MFSRIGACCRYADRQHRLVIVETDFPGSLYFRDDFGRYFISHDPNLVLSSRHYVSQFDCFDVEPAAFKERVNQYKVDYNNDVSALAEVGTALIPRFDLNRKHDAPLLLYHSVGGGLRKAEIALRRISISSMVLQALNERLARIGGSYTSIHIRHTDYSTEYRQRISILRTKILGPVYVATDNREALEFCRQVFGNDRVFNFTVLPDVAGEAIHDNVKLNAQQSNVDSICDLLLLAIAKTYYFFPIANSTLDGPAYSGFSKLAELLHTDKALLRQFMDVDTFDWRARMRLRLRKVFYRSGSLALALMPPKRRAH
jgi:hypothetical protein